MSIANKKKDPLYYYQSDLSDKERAFKRAFTEQFRIFRAQTGQLALGNASLAGTLRDTVIMGVISLSSSIFSILMSVFVAAGIMSGLPGSLIGLAFSVFALVAGAMYQSHSSGIARKQYKKSAKLMNVREGSIIIDEVADKTMELYNKKLDSIPDEKIEDFAAERVHVISVAIMQGHVKAFSDLTKMSKLELLYAAAKLDKSSFDVQFNTTRIGEFLKLHVSRANVQQDVSVASKAEPGSTKLSDSKSVTFADTPKVERGRDNFASPAPVKLAV